VSLETHTAEWPPYCESELIVILETGEADTVSGAPGSPSAHTAVETGEVVEVAVAEKVAETTLSEEHAPDLLLV